jgi:hypothetical protein
VQVPLAVVQPGPGGSAELAAPVVRRTRRAVGPAAARPHVVPRPLGAARRRLPGGAEPLVVDGGVVADQVDRHPQAVGVGFRDERVEVLEVAEHGVDGARVGHVVAVVGHGRGVERREPQRVDAEQFQVAQPRPHALQVADAVAVGVAEAGDVDLVHDGVAPPGPLRHDMILPGGGASCRPPRRGRAPAAGAVGRAVRSRCSACSPPRRSCTATAGRGAPRTARLVDGDAHGAQPGVALERPTR